MSGNSSGKFKRNIKMFSGISLVILIVILTVLAITLTNGLPSNDVVVTIPELGSLRGSTSKSAWSNKDIYQFRGIHFAEAPSGVRRFQPPIPRAPWLEIKDASDNGINCPVITALQELTLEQLSERDWEDCLHLSVYTKNFALNLPVMFYIHGGGYINGSASDHPPGYLLENDVVLVTTQYRLGALGFLSTNTKEIPGNVAILDIILALEWVQKNIRFFGGDPNHVTIFGQSAGAGIVSALTLSPIIQEGLFHRVIIQSGSVFSGWGYEPKPIKKAKNIAKAAGCNSVENLDVVNNFFINLPLLKLMEITALSGFTMTLADLNNVLPDTPKNLWEKCTRSYPTMGGVTKHDGVFQFANIYNAIGDRLEKSVDSLQMIEDVSWGLGLKDDTGLTSIMMMKMLFTPKQLQGGNFTELLPGFIDMSNNVIIKSPTLRFLQLSAQRNPSETYLYAFDYVGSNTRFGYGHPTDHYPFNGGVHHSDDNLYIFPTIPLNQKDMEIAKVMSSLWTSFATTGVPKSSKVESWPPLTKKTGPYLHINEDCSLGNNFLDELTVTVDDEENSIVRPLCWSRL